MNVGMRLLHSVTVNGLLIKVTRCNNFFFKGAIHCILFYFQGVHHPFKGRRHTTQAVSPMEPGRVWECFFNV